MLQSRVKYTVSVECQSYQRGIFAMVLKWSLQYCYCSWDTAWWCARNSCGKRYSLFFSVSLNRVDAGLYFLIANFHTELEPQVNVSLAW